MPDIDLAKLRIVHYPDPCLKKVCKPFEDFDGTLPGLAAKMLELMHAAVGIGLAGPQVAVLRRIFVCNVTGEPKDDLVFVNPKLTNFIGHAEAEEGCLSLPDINVSVRRPQVCTIEALDVHGKPFKMEGSDLLARCWQHEYDHLDGRLIVDTMSEADKIANRRSVKHLESNYRRPATVF
ncbi:MAG: peptide deformylase [Planctomycetota bacterium]